jgi:hypothetical protein
VRLFRDAYRALRATPIVSAVAILSLTLGIGANTALFSILDSLLLKPLPVYRPNELVVVGDVGQSQYFALSYPVWKEIRERGVFDRAFAWATDRVNLSNTARMPSRRQSGPLATCSMCSVYPHCWAERST